MKTSKLFLSLLLVSTTPLMADSSERCNCLNKNTNCFAQTRHDGNTVKITSNVPQCSMVVWYADKQPHVTVVTDGQASVKLDKETKPSMLMVSSCEVCDDSQYPRKDSPQQNTRGYFPPPPMPGFPMNDFSMNGFPGEPGFPGDDDFPPMPPMPEIPPLPEMPPMPMDMPAGSAKVSNHPYAGIWRSPECPAPATNQSLNNQLSLQINGNRVSGMISTTTQNFMGQATIEGTVHGKNMKLLSNWNSKHNITISDDGKTMVDNWCNKTGACTTCTYKR